MGMNEMAMITGLMTSMTMLYENPREQRKTVTLRGKSRKKNPWDHIQLSKQERKGKTFKEIQALRVQKWEQMKLA